MRATSVGNVVRRSVQAIGPWTRREPPKVTPRPRGAAERPIGRPCAMEVETMRISGRSSALRAMFLVAIIALAACSGATGGAASPAGGLFSGGSGFDEGDGGGRAAATAAPSAAPAAPDAVGNLV